MAGTTIIGFFVEKGGGAIVEEKISVRGFGEKSPSFITFAEYHVSVADNCRHTWNTENKTKIFREPLVHTPKN